MAGKSSQVALLLLSHGLPPADASYKTWQPLELRFGGPFHRCVKATVKAEIRVRFITRHSAVRDRYLGRGLSVHRHRHSRLKCSGGGNDEEVANARTSEGDKNLIQRHPDDVELSILKRWDVPWDGKATALGMLSWFCSFLLTGLAVSVVSVKLGFGRRQFMEMDEQSLFVFIHQLLQTIAGLSAINIVVSPFKPLPPEIFSFDWRSPFDLQRGWLLWGAGGVLLAGPCVVAAAAITSFANGEPPPRDDADALSQLLPLIGISPASTASLIVVTGVLAPLLEETVFRGFLLTSLTKWVSTPAAILISAGAFALAHLTPGEFPQLFALGVVLGLSYAQTRNLFTPVFIHSLWNSGVVILLTALRLQGYDIKELL